MAVQRLVGLPWIMLSALVGLSLGGAALGLVQAPASTDLTVHNAIGETLAAPTFVAVSSSSRSTGVTRLDFRAPTHLVLTSLATPGAASPLQTEVLNGAAVTRALAPIATLGTVTGFSQQHGVYSAPLVNPTLAREGASARVSLSVAGGYLTSVVERITIDSSEGSGTVSGTVRFHKIGDWTVPVA